MDVRSNLENNDEFSIENINSDILCCPITGEPFTDPVIIASGHTFERTAILEWFKNHNTCPMTRMIVNTDNIIANINLRLFINYVDSMSITCPLNRKLMEDPVVIESGHTFERKAIEKWIKTHNTCPLMGSSLSVGNKNLLISNYALKGLIEAWKAKQEAQRRKDKGKEKEDAISSENNGHRYVEGDIVLISSTKEKNEKLDSLKELIRLDAAFEFPESLNQFDQTLYFQNASLEAAEEEWEELFSISNPTTGSSSSRNDNATNRLLLLKIEIKVQLLIEQLQLLKELFNLATSAEREEISNTIPRWINAIHPSNAFYAEQNNYSCNQIQEQIFNLFYRLVNRSNLRSLIRHSLTQTFAEMLDLKNDIENADVSLVICYKGLIQAKIQEMLELLKNSKSKLYCANAPLMFRASFSQESSIPPLQENVTERDSKKSKRCSLM